MATASDTFTRSDGAVGGNWTDTEGGIYGTGPLQVVSNKLRTVAGEYREGRYTATPPATVDHWEEVTLSVDFEPMEGIVNLLLRHVGAGTTRTGYLCQFHLYNQEWYINEIDENVETTIASGSTAFAEGDVLRAEISGTTITAKQNGGILGSVSNSAHAGGLGWGVGMYEGAHAVDNFNAADFAPAGTTANTTHSWSLTIPPAATAVGYATVTLVAPIYTGPGSITYESTFVGTPVAGDVIRYPTTDGLVVYPDGTFSLNVNTGSYGCFYNDGGGEDAFTLTITNATFTYAAFPTPPTTSPPDGSFPISSAAIDPTVVFGTGTTFTAQLSISGIAPTVAFGTQTVSGGLTIPSIPSEEAFGAAVLSSGGLIIPSIPSEEAFGAATLGTSIVSSAGIDSTVVFGTATVSYTGIGPPSIDPTVAFGTPNMESPVSPGGIDSSNLWGTPLINKKAVLSYVVEITGDG